ncbi:MAG TPA: MFS transporter [Streptosporangiaceae bacterium]
MARSRPAWAVLVVCCVAQFMVVLDVTIVNVALPGIKTSLGMTTADQQWVINAYTLTFAGFLMLGARAADLFGRRRVFLVGLGLFTLCSLAGGLADAPTWLIAARAGQGLGGAILAPATLSTLTATFTEEDQRRRVLGAWSATAASGAAAGLVAGGVLTDLLDWRWVLFVNVPIGAVLAFAAFPSLAPERPTATGKKLDTMGAVTVTAALTLLVYGIVTTDQHSWSSPVTVTFLGAGIVAFAGFLVVEARFAKQPLVPLGIFANRSVVVANTVAATIGASLFGMYFFVSLYLQQINGYSPLRAGFAFVPAGLATMTGALVGTRVVKRVGPRRQLLIGLPTAALGMAWLTQAVAGSAYLTHVLIPLLLTGVGLGLSFVPSTMSGTAGLPPSQAGLASGLITTTRQVGAAIGLAAMTTVATTHMTDETDLHPSSVITSTGIDRAFAVNAAILVAGALFSLLLRPNATAKPVASRRNQDEQSSIAHSSCRMGDHSRR